MNKAKQKKVAQAYKNARALTVGMQVVTWESWQAGNSPDGKPIYDCSCKDRYGYDVPRQLFHVAARINRAWQIKIRVKCRADDGQEYIEETELEAQDVKLDDFTDVYKRERQATIDACNPKHIRDVGWSAKALD